MGGTPNTQATPGTSFWAALTGCNSTGLYYDWSAVIPTANTATAGNPWTFTAASMWSIRQPYTVGWGNLREANGPRGIDPRSVVRIEFIGYAPAPSGASGMPSGTSTDQEQGMNAIDPSGAIPLYLFQHTGQAADPPLRVHDHRDQFNGGFAFSVYHPGTALPQQPWGI